MLTILEIHTYFVVAHQGYENQHYKTFVINFIERNRKSLVQWFCCTDFKSFCVTLVNFDQVAFYRAFLIIQKYILTVSAKNPPLIVQNNPLRLKQNLNILNLYVLDKIGLRRCQEGLWRCKGVLRRCQFGLGKCQVHVSDKAGLEKCQVLVSDRDGLGKC